MTSENIEKMMNQLEKEGFINNTVENGSEERAGQIMEQLKDEEHDKKTKNIKGILLNRDVLIGELKAENEKLKRLAEKQLDGLAEQKSDWFNSGKQEAFTNVEKRIKEKCDVDKDYTADYIIEEIIQKLREAKHE